MDGYLQPLLASASVPLTGLFAWKLNGSIMTSWMIAGSVVVLIGLCVAVIPPAVLAEEGHSE